jgi:cyclophilin family peptidyl-prolyl cis-trans isomerase
MVVLSTSHGDLTIELFSDDAPISVENFLQYVDDGYFDGTIFHRVIAGFMIQCGGFTPEMSEKETRAPIKNEAQNGRKNQRGTLAMARTSDIDSATSQFFINVSDNDFLDNGARDFGYAVFGRVTDGLDVVDQIAAAPSGNKAGHSDVPNDPIIINSAKRA